MRRRQQFAVAAVAATIGRGDGPVLDLGFGALIAQARFPFERAGFAVETHERLDPRFVDGVEAASDRQIRTECARQRRPRGRRVGDGDAVAVGGDRCVALFARVRHAEAQCIVAIADVALVAQFEREFAVLDVGVGAVAGVAVVFGEGPAVAQVFVLVLQLELPVVEAGPAEFHARVAAGHRPVVIDAERPVVGADVEVVVVDGQQIRVVLDAVGVFQRILVLQPVGAHVEQVDAELARADVCVVGGVEGAVVAAAHVGLHFGVVERAARCVEAPAELVLRVAAALAVDAKQQIAAQRFAAPHRAEQRLGLAVVVAQRADAQIAAVERMAVAQHDIERTGNRVAAAVGRGRTHDLDALDQLRRNAIDEERSVETGAGHALAIDEDLRVAGIEAAQAHTVVFQHVGQEGHAGHPLEHVADGQRLELLEVFQIVDQRRWRLGAVAVNGFAADHDRVERIGAAVRRGRGRGLRAGLRNGERRDGHEE